MTFDLPDLHFAYNALEPYIDEQTMKIHHTKHHQAYVDKLNAALKGHGKFAEWRLDQLLADLGAVPEEIRWAVRNNGGGHGNHSLFWKQLTPTGPTEPSGELADAITATFGGVAEFKKQFTEAALGRFGSGWAWLVVQEEALAIGSTTNQDTPAMGEDFAGISGTPLIGLDVWEHAYYLLYQNRRPEYVEAFWNVLNWQEIEKRYKQTL